MIAAVILAVGLGPFGSSAHRDVVRGKREYEAEQYQEALKHFRNAQVDLPEEGTVLYDLGCAQYRLQEYDKAAESFKKSAQSPQEEVSVAATYNLGNSLYHLGDLEGAIDAYERVLEMDEDHEDARFNLEYVRQKIKEMLDSSKQRQERQQQQQENEDAGDSQGTQDRQDPKEGEGEEAEQRRGEEQGSEQEPGVQAERQEEKERPEAPQEEDASGQEGDVKQAKEEEQDAEEAGAEAVEMTQEEAEQLLRALAQEEEEVRTRESKRAPGRSGAGGPDW